MTALCRIRLRSPLRARCYRWNKANVPRVAVALALAFASAPAVATEALSGLELIGERVPDEQLATMRGKFIAPNSITYFGVMMTTSWQGPDGITTQANLLFRIDFAGGAGSTPSPHLSIGWTREGDAALDLGSFGQAAQSGYVMIGANGALTPLVAADSSGAVQSNVIAGADNHALNGMSILVVPASLIDQTTPNGLTEVAAGQATSFPNGDKLQFILSPGTVGISIGNGPNGAQQQIDSAFKQASQSINLASDHYSAANLMGITVGIDPSLAANQMQVDQILLSRANLGF